MTAEGDERLIREFYRAAMFLLERIKQQVAANTAGAPARAPGDRQPHLDPRAEEAMTDVLALDIATTTGWARGNQEQLCAV